MYERLHTANQAGQTTNKQQAIKNSKKQKKHIIMRIKNWLKIVF